MELLCKDANMLNILFGKRNVGKVKLKKCVLFFFYLDLWNVLNVLDIFQVICSYWCAVSELFTKGRTSSKKMIRVDISLTEGAGWLWSWSGGVGGSSLSLGKTIETVIPVSCHLRTNNKRPCHFSSVWFSHWLDLTYMLGYLYVFKIRIHLHTWEKCRSIGSCTPTSIHCSWYSQAYSWSLLSRMHSCSPLSYC